MKYGMTAKQVEALNEFLEAISKNEGSKGPSEYGVGFDAGIDFAVFHIQGYLRALETINRIIEEKSNNE